MPKVTAKKTESAPDAQHLKSPLRKKRYFIAFLLILIGILGSVFFFDSPTWACHAYQIADNYRNDQQLVIGGKEYEVEVPDSADSLKRGLSGRPCISDNQAMLFVFEESKKHCFWMKDMRFFIDMVWLDADKRIVHIKENADPASYPQNFCPPLPAKYVLEFKTGIAHQLNLAIGQQLTF